MTLNNIVVFLALTGLYEPSAIQQLADGRFLVVEDEKQHPISLLTISPSGRDGDGDEKKSRDKLVRFRIEGDRVVEPRVVTGLKRALTAMHPVLAAAAGSGMLNPARRHAV